MADISGLAMPVIFNLESKQCNPKLETLVKYLEALEIDLSDVIRQGLHVTHNIKENEIMKIDDNSSPLPKAKGIKWNETMKKWRACIRFDNNLVILGYYDEFHQAKEVRLKAEKDVVRYYNTGKFPSDTLIRHKSISQELYEIDSFRKSNIVGVNWDKNRNKWRAKIKVNGKNISLGSYQTIEEATEARQQGEIKYFGDTVDKLYVKTPNKNNKSGVIGVHWNESRELWCSKISFMGETFTLGQFKDIGEAESVRKLAEQNILNGTFLKWYNKRYFTKSNVKDHKATTDGKVNVGDMFETFKVISFHKKDDQYRKYWICKCENCGNEKTIREDYLKNLKFGKCTCENIKKQIDTKKRMIFNTNVGKIESNKAYSNSKTGVRGVYWDIVNKKWRSIIYFKKKAYELGLFNDINDAIKARNEAEEKLYGDFLEWYKKAYQNGKS